jgi:hypothetical protein
MDKTSHHSLARCFSVVVVGVPSSSASSKSRGGKLFLSSFPVAATGMLKKELSIKMEIIKSF